LELGAGWLTLFDTVSAPRRGKPQVGQRCALVERDGEVATIRFVGTTKFAPGIWIGVELDTANGKNDGSIAGIKYFDAPANCGLFVKPTLIEVLTAAEEKAMLATEASGGAPPTESHVVASTAPSPIVTPVAAPIEPTPTPIVVAVEPRVVASIAPPPIVTPVAAPIEPTPTPIVVAVEPRVVASTAPPPVVVAVTPVAAPISSSQVDELLEQLELVTLDKEIAEEKCEQLESAIVQLERDIEKLRTAATAAAATTTTTTMAAASPVATSGAPNAALIQQLQAAVLQQKDQIQTYKEQLEAHAESAAIAERLSEKVLTLEAELQEAQEQVQELTAFKDAADELEESMQMAEKELRQQLHACQVQLLDARDREASLQQLVKELQMSILSAAATAAAAAAAAAASGAASAGSAAESAAPAAAPAAARIVINNSSQLAVDAALQQLEVQHYRRKMALLEKLLPLDVVDLTQIEVVLTCDRARDKCGLVNQRCEQLLLNEAAPEGEAVAALTCGRQMRAAQHAFAQVGGGGGGKLPERGDVDAVEVLVDSILQLVRGENFLDTPAPARRVALLATNLVAAPQPAVQTRDSIDELVFRARVRLVRTLHGDEGGAVGEVRTTLETARQLQRAQTTHVLDLAPLLRGTFASDVDEGDLARQIAALIAQVRVASEPPPPQASARQRFQPHLERVRGQLHATAAQQIELHELRAQLNQRKVEQLQLERLIAEKEYTCQTLQGKFDKARTSEQAALAAARDAHARLEQQQKESLQALDKLREELAATERQDDGAAEQQQQQQQQQQEQQQQQAQDAPDTAAAVVVSLESTYLLRTIQFLQKELERARQPIELPPALDVAALQRLRQPLTASTQIATTLHQVRMLAARATVPDLCGSDAVQQHQLRRARRQQTALLKRKVINMK
jgi:hypothetical protein